MRCARATPSDIADSKAELIALESLHETPSLPAMIRAAQYTKNSLVASPADTRCLTWSPQNSPHSGVASS